MRDDVGKAGTLSQVGSGSGKPVDEMPRSPSGRVPQWVIDEALGSPKDAVPWRGAYPSLQPEPRRHGRRRWSRGLASAAVVVAVIGAAAWLQVGGALKPRSSNGFTSRLADSPKPGHEESDHPLGVPAPLLATSSSFRYMAQQTDGAAPVAYDPCRPIHYVIRQQGEPAGADRIVADAVLRVSQATGLHFVYDGPTSEAPSRQRALYQPKAYGDRWAPVLISWVTPNENPDFAADVTGEGGSTHIGFPNRPSAYVTGAVELDSAQIATILQRHDGHQVVRGIVLHELGHLVGLGHVTDATQLMYPEGQPGVTDFAMGDLAGLAALGRGTCRPEL